MHNINPLKTQLNPICHLLELLGAHPILHVSRIRVKKVIGLCTDVVSTCRFCEKLIATTQHVTLWVKCRIKRNRYKRVRR